MPGYQVDVMKRDTRMEMIAAKIGPNPERRIFHDFSRPLSLAVIRMPIEALVYRMKNGRTRIEQAKYLRERELDKTFFSSGQENVSAQRAQHELLLAFAQTSKGKVLGEVLKKAAKQTEALLVTRKGVVVNGNRRLAQMRELLSGDKDGKYAGFTSLECMVLEEGISEADLREIEIRLQGAKDPKLDYNWIDEILLAQDLVTDKKSEKQIASFQNITEKELRLRLRMLEEAKLYVSRYHDGGDQLDILRDEPGAEQQFTELVKAMDDLPEARLDDARSVHYVLTANPTVGRKYGYRIAYSETELPTVMERLATREGLPLGPIGSKALDDEFTEEPERAAEANQFEHVRRFLLDKSDSERKAKVIRSIVDEIEAEREDAAKETRALRKVNEALATLNAVNVREASAATFPEIRDALSKIRDLADRLASEVASAPNT